MSQIEQLMDMSVVGNAHSDRLLFDLAHTIILDDTNPMSDRINAIKKIDEAMGEISESYSEADVHEYVAGEQ